MPEGLDNLQHVVVLMMENRSFDHMLGFGQTADWEIDGLLASSARTNDDSAGVTVPVSNDATYAGGLTPDPGHSGFDSLSQLYGDPNTPVTASPVMSGFVRSYEGKTGNPQDGHRIMRCFSPSTLPVLSSLARQFCVCDRWFSSLPGPTFPNRAFLHAATSMGRVDMGIDWRKLSPTIYERLKENKCDSMIYYHDSTMASTFDSLAGDNGFFGSFDNDFLTACSTNDLPTFSFLEPRFANSPGGNGQPAYSASDQHPDHNVREGEALIQTTFGAIWNNVKVRNSTLLVIVYDEHGGTYDHVVPPATLNPDGKVWTNDGTTGSLDPSFDFTRLGVRVPAVLISPYIPPSIDSNLYDHSSIIATVFKKFIPGSYLTLRDKTANTFEQNLSLPNPRTDEIDTGPAVKSQPPSAKDLAQPLNDHLKMLVSQAAQSELRLPADQRTGIDPNTITTEEQAAVYLQSVHARLHRKG